MKNGGLDSIRDLIEMGEEGHDWALSLLLLNDVLSGGLLVSVVCDFYDAQVLAYPLILFRAMVVCLGPGKPQRRKIHTYRRVCVSVVSFACLLACVPVYFLGRVHATNNVKRTRKWPLLIPTSHKRVT